MFGSLGNNFLGVTAMFEAAALFVASHFVFLSRLSVLSQRLSASQFSHSITALILSQKQVEKKRQLQIQL